MDCFVFFAGQRNDTNWSHNIRSQNIYLENNCIQSMPYSNATPHDHNYSAQFDFNTNPMNTTNNENNAALASSTSTHSNCRDIESAIKSITSTFDSMVTIEKKDCEYSKLVISFKRTLVLPDIFFSFDTPACYCILCSSSTKEKNTLEGIFLRLDFHFSHPKVMWWPFVHIVVFPPSHRLGTIQTKSYDDKSGYSIGKRTIRCIQQRLDHRILH